MAQAWAALGSRVTLVHRGDRLIEREEPFAGDQVADALRDYGVDLGSGRASRRSRGTASSRSSSRAAARSRRTSCSSRSGARLAPATSGWTTVGLEPRQARDRRRLAPRPREGLAVRRGDVNGRALLTHMGKYQARLAADAIMGKTVRLRSDGGASPRVIFTDPQVGAVG